MKSSPRILGLLGVVIVAAVGIGYWLWQGASVGGGLPREISAAEAQAKQAAGAFVLDVRTVEEWNEAHLTGAILIPLDQLGQRLSEVPRDREIVVMCRSGNRSATGRDILLNAGFTRVTSMAGGIRDWMAAGYSTVSGP
jgi:rhodanese-related sulfurtransferase